MDQLPTRKSARLLVLDREDRLLLIRFEVQDPDLAEPGEKLCFWATVGGEIEADESFESALSRELYEETGLTADQAEISHCVWHGRQELDIAGVKTDCYERFAIARVRSNQVSFANMTELEQEVCTHYKWWTLDELQTTSERIYPASLANLLQPLLKGNIPEKSIKIAL